MELPKVTKRAELLRRLKRLDCEELPKGRSKETFVKRAGTKRKVRIPNQHRGREIQKYELKLILDGLGISEEEWNGTA